MNKRVYLAGPEIFLVNAREIGARKKAICERHGLVGIFPADEEDAYDPALPLRDRGLAISRAMERVIRTCDAMIVNLTPFRGPSADVGSAYEMGFMRALGRPIFAYTNDHRPLFERVVAYCGDAARVRLTGEYEDADSMAIEPFTLHENLMLECGVIASGGSLVAASTPYLERYTCLTVFERCVAAVAAVLLPVPHGEPLSRVRQDQAAKAVIITTDANETKPWRHNRTREISELTGILHVAGPTQRAIRCRSCDPAASGFMALFTILRYNARVLHHMSGTGAKLGAMSGRPARIRPA